MAHLVIGKMTHSIERDGSFTIARTRMKETAGRTLAESTLHTSYGVTIVGVERQGIDFADTRLDLPIASGASRDLEHVAALA